ncbi:septin-9-like, partial [Echinops telfairi]|uniref:Septin-9-like n=1 Tax=Echinops telfairi TaxID=9371 RepID=A0ABM0J9N1_ECHTE
LSSPKTTIFPASLGAITACPEVSLVGLSSPKTTIFPASLGAITACPEVSLVDLLRTWLPSWQGPYPAPAPWGAQEAWPQACGAVSLADIEEKGVRMKLTVIDTPGFGDHINNENCWQPIMKFINDQYEKYLQEEVNINRKKRIPDTRVHCCLYFIPATGHALRPLDIEFMKRLSKVVNIVPVIAKADTLTLDERVYFKQRITADLLSNGIDVYPQKEFDEDSEDRLVNEKFREMIPFAVVGSDHEYQVNGKRILGRKTKWGTI